MEGFHCMFPLYMCVHVCVCCTFIRIALVSDHLELRVSLEPGLNGL